ncbi:MAG: hypothetical protein LAP61_25635 [Acidobacteriia bacterium]|nr:hypothetical protein [Terriglobia bacterium]
MDKRLVFVAAGAGLLLAALPVAAHHAFAAEFDSNKPVKLQGTVAKVEMVNPHSWIYIDVKNPDGTTSQWMVEGGSPNALVRHGFTKNTLPKGTEVIFEGFQAKDGAFRANGRDITLPNGKKLLLGSSGNEAPPEDKDKDKDKDTKKQ